MRPAADDVAELVERDAEVDLAAEADGAVVVPVRRRRAGAVNGGDVLGELPELVVESDGTVHRLDNALAPVGRPLPPSFAELILHQVAGDGWLRDRLGRVGRRARRRRRR